MTFEHTHPPDSWHARMTCSELHAHIDALSVIIPHWITLASNQRTRYVTITSRRPGRAAQSTQHDNEEQAVYAAQSLFRYAREIERKENHHE